MTEFRRDKILPEDLIQRTNLSQHNMMIDAINDIDGRQGDIERITNVNIDDIVDLKTDVITLSNEKLDKADIDEDIHFGPITITKDGTAVIASFDAINPTTGAVTPLSFTLPGATSTDAGVMDASSVAWITNAEARISALEGLSDVKAIVGLNATPTQAEINSAWMDEVGKAPETGDFVQDVSNAKLWVYVTDTWTLYSTLMVVPLATTTSLGGVKDTALNAPSNRWYGHVEADGRLSLIGGDSLSTLLDTTVPGIQTAVNGKVSKTGGETISGVKTFTSSPTVNQDYAYLRLKSKLDNSNVTFHNRNSPEYTTLFRSQDDGTTNSYTLLRTVNNRTGKMAEIMVRVDDADSEGYMTAPRRSNPGTSDVVTKGYLDTRLSASKVEVSDGLALKVDKGSTITASDGVAIFNDITTNFWRQCGNSDVTNFVSVMTSSQYLYCYISPDGNQTSYTVCKNTDAINNGGYTSYTMMVPKNWYYKIDFSSVPNIICSVVEQPLSL